MVQAPTSPVSHPEFEYLRRRLSRSSARLQHSMAGPGEAPAVVSRPTAERVIAQINSRRDRERRFGCSLFSDPVWDMLLALYLAHLQSRTLSAAELCIASGAPANVALRWISVLDREKLLDESDEIAGAGRMRISLSQLGIAHMDEHFETTA